MRADLTQRDLIDALYKKHRQAVQTGQGWLTIWEVFNNDPWFQAAMKAAIATAKNRYQLSPDLFDDVGQDAQVVFSGNLQKATDLNFEISKGSYRVFLQTIVFRSAMKAAARVHASFNQSLQLPAEVLDTGGQPVSNHRICSFIEQLPDSMRIVLNSYVEGANLKSIARQINRTERTVFRILREALARLKEIANVENE